MGQFQQKDRATVTAMHRDEKAAQQKEPKKCDEKTAEPKKETTNLSQDDDVEDEDEEAKKEKQRRRAEWLSMFHLSVNPSLALRTPQDRKLEAARLVGEMLREHPTMPAHPHNPDLPWTDVDNGGRLPPVSCAFKGCSWVGGREFTDAEIEDDPEHPWDQHLRVHVVQSHGGDIAAKCAHILEESEIKHLAWDLYKQGIAILQRQIVPIVGPSVDRRTIDQLAQVYNNKRIRSLICFCCAQIKVDTGRCRSRISFRSTRWLLGLGANTITKNFSMETFRRRYCVPNTPLAYRGHPDKLGGMASPDFSDWSVTLQETTVNNYLATPSPPTF